jgi:type I restriction enzyme S subunit
MTTHDYPTYAAYQDSGVEWLGEIPVGWEVRRLKYALNLSNEKVSSIDSDLPYVGMENIETKSGRYIESKSEVEGLANIFKIGNILFGKLRPYLAKVHLAEFDGICSTEFLVYQSFYPNYFSKLLLSDRFIRVVNASTYGAKMPRASSDFVGNLRIPLPPLPTQTAIATFLDDKCAKIDRAIAQKEQLIALLKERKQIVIQQAVTKGLDPEVPMKDSGVAWIGEIPVGWEVRRVNHIFQLIIDPAPKSNDFELLSIYTNIGVRPRKDLEEKGNRASTTDGYWIVKKGDFIVNKLLAWMGAIGLSEYEGVTSPAYDILRPITKIENWYFHELFRTKICQSELNRNSRGIMEMRLRLYFDKFGSIKVPFPPIQEQAAIVAHIEAQSANIDRAIGLQQTQIEKLKEYKATLIDSAVTGKIKVPTLDA